MPMRLLLSLLLMLENWAGLAAEAHRDATVTSGGVRQSTSTVANVSTSVKPTRW
jgi:hypothetical protein